MDATLLGFITAIQKQDSDLQAAQQQAAAVQAQLEQVNQALTAAENDRDTARQDVALLQQAKADLTLQLGAAQQAVADAQKALQDLAAKEPMDIIAARLETLRNAAVLSGLHRLPRSATDSEIKGFWKDPGGALADSNPATATTPHGIATWNTSAAGPTRFEFAAAARLAADAATDNCFMFTPVQFPVVLPTYLVDIRQFQLTAADRSAINCLEWENQIIIGGHIHNMAYQLNYTSGQVRVFNYTAPAGTDKWVAVPGIPVPEIVSAPGNFACEFALDKVNHTTTHIAITINGVRYLVGKTFACGVGSPTTNKHTVAVQLDSKAMPAGIKPPVLGVNIGNIEVRYW